MSGGFPFGLDICNGTDPNIGAGFQGTSVTAGHNAYGSYTQLVSSTSHDTCWMLVRIWPTNNTSFRTLTKIAVGAAASEKDIIFDLYASSGTNGNVTTEYSFPCNIPAGTRISAACCNNGTTDSNLVVVMLFDGAFAHMDGCAGVDSIGMTTASSQATDVDPGGTANTKGSYVQLTSSTARDYVGIIVNQGSNSTDNFSYTSPGSIDIAIGSSGNEIIILPDMAMCPHGAFNNAYSHPPFFPIAIPAGTRISARAQQGNITSGTRVPGVCCYGVYQ